MATKIIPDVENEVSLSSKELNIPNQRDNIDWSTRTKVRNRKVSHTSSGPDKVLYGSKAMMTKESLTFTDYLLEKTDQPDVSILPVKVIGEIKSNIRSGAKDVDQEWKNALELVNTAYHVTNVRRPVPTEKGGWNQYEQMIAFAVKSLHDYRGINGNWRLTPVGLVESKQKDPSDIDSHRFFVELPGERPQEVQGIDMDDIIDKVSNVIRSSKRVTNTKVRIESRTSSLTVLVVYVGGIKRERITIKQL